MDLNFIGRLFMSWILVKVGSILLTQLIYLGLPTVQVYLVRENSVLCSFGLQT